MGCRWVDYGWDTTIKAIEVVDECIGEVVDSVKNVDGITIITSDHGNAEDMIEDGCPKTAHSCNKVPFIVIGNELILRDGILADIAPTILELLDIPQPTEMTGRSLIVPFGKS